MASDPDAHTSAAGVPSRSWIRWSADFRVRALRLGALVDNREALFPQIVAISLSYFPLQFFRTSRPPGLAIIFGRSLCLSSSQKYLGLLPVVSLPRPGADGVGSALGSAHRNSREQSCVHVRAFARISLLAFTREYGALMDLCGDLSIGLYFALLYWRSGNLWIIGILHGVGDLFVDGLPLVSRLIK